MTSSDKIAEQIRELQSSRALTIIEITDALWPKDVKSDQKRNSGVSDASTDADENPTPAALEAELTHYKV
jgi:hypothetical protein